jgi:predicted dehydrogenase
MILRIGLLGASRIAPKAIIAAAQARIDTQITAVAARDLGRAQAYAQTHRIPAAVESYDALIARDDVDLIYCALPPAGHIAPCLAALRAGKALLIEKPFAMTADEARQIASAAAEAGRPAIEAFHYRFHGMFLRALDLVRDGRLGRLIRAEGWFDAEIHRAPGALRWDPAQGGGGTMDLGCYVLHGLRALIGAEPRLASADATLEGGVDVEMRATLGFPGDVTAEVRSSMIKPRADGLILQGDQATLRLERFVAPQNGGVLTLSDARGDHHEPAHGPSSYEAQLAHVVAVMRGEAQPVTGGADAVANMTIIDALRQTVGMALN